MMAVVPAYAQSGQTAPGDDGAAPSTDIVVTAQKRTERLLDVPVPVTSVSAEALVTENLVKLSDFYSRIPGLQYSGGRTSNLSIRGITSGGSTAATVAILIDDVPFGGTTSAGQPPIPDFDPGTLERIEVLRGPQGTLYGASSLGGLIKYVTRTPDTHELSGRVEIGGNTVDGGNQGYSGRASINVPIVQDRVALSVSGFYRNDPRWLDNIYTSAAAKNVNKKETWGGRAALLVKPTDTLTITLSAIRQKQQTENSDLAITSGGIRICPECSVPSTGNTVQTNFQPVYADLTTLNTVPSTGDSTFAQSSARGELDLGWGQVTSITAWGRADNVLSNDVTSTFGGLFRAYYGSPTSATVLIENADYTHKFSQELRLAGSGDRLDWLVGGFYTVEHAGTDQALFLSSPEVTPYAGSGPSSYREFAGFADLTYHATDKLDIEVGGRLSKNKQRSVQTQVIDDAVVDAFGPTDTATARSDDTAFTWLVSPNYHFSKDIMGYVRVATGYRPGGPNISGGTSAATFKSDTVTNYEVGLKGYVVPNTLTLDMSLFQIDWKDIQLQNTDAVSQLTFLTNGSKARSRGAEVATQWRAWRNFTLDANATFTDAVLTEDIPSSDTATGLSGKSGDRLPFTSKFTTSVSGRQTFTLSDQASAFFGATYTYVGDRMSAFGNSAASATRPRFTLPAYSLVDLQAGVTLDKSWQASLYMRNAFNKFGVIAAQNRNGTSVPTAIFTQPRTIGVTLARNV